MPTDDNFYALLGTMPGNSATRLLKQYSSSFAAKEAGGSDRVLAAKSIRDIRIAATVVPLAPPPGTKSKMARRQ